MTIKLTGTLVVKNVHGRNGHFAVGDLNTDIGKFKVKDAILDQYQEGEYRGSFIVTQIFPSSYVWGGKVVTEIRVNLAEIFLEEAEEKPIPEIQSEPDPVMVDASPVASGAGADGAVPVIPVVDSDDPDAGLFGELYDTVRAAKPVKLDPTIDRGQFRLQRDRLKELGFKFAAATQTWEPPSDE